MSRCQLHLTNMDVQYRGENYPFKNINRYWYIVAETLYLVYTSLIVVRVCCITYLTELYTLGNALQAFLPRAVWVQGTLQEGMVQHFHPDHEHILCRNVIPSGPFEFQTKWHRSELKYWKDNGKVFDAASEWILEREV